MTLRVIALAGVLLLPGCAAIMPFVVGGGLGLAASVFKLDDDLLLAYLQAKHPNSVVAITPAVPVSPGPAPLPIDATVPK